MRDCRQAVSTIASEMSAPLLYLGLLILRAVECIQFSSAAQSRLTLCDPMSCSKPGLPVHHQLPKSIRTHVHHRWHFFHALNLESRLMSRHIIYTEPLTSGEQELYVSKIHMTGNLST